jgi:RNA polymerase sigma-70 factor (family 1)
LPGILLHGIMNVRESIKDIRYASSSDKELLHAMSSGDQVAFTVLFNRHWKSLFAFVHKLTQDENETKDILQDVFVHIWNSKEKLYANESFLPYLNTVAYSNVMMAFRRNKIKLQGTDTLLQMVERSMQSDDRLLYMEAKQSVDHALEKMPVNMRQCFRLSRFDEKSIREIAAELGLSEQTVKNNISEALRRLKLSIGQGSLLYFSLLLLKAVMKD